MKNIIILLSLMLILSGCTFVSEKEVNNREQCKGMQDGTFCTYGMWYDQYGRACGGESCVGLGSGKCFNEGCIMDDEYSTLTEDSSTTQENSFFEQNTSFWVEINPIQCFGNPWEEEWVEKHIDYYGSINNAYKAYPHSYRVKGVELTEMKSIIKGYYEKQGITISDVKTITFTEKNGHKTLIESSCSSEAGYTLYLLILKNDVNKMFELGYKLSGEGISECTIDEDCSTVLGACCAKDICQYDYIAINNKYKDSFDKQKTELCQDSDCAKAKCGFRKNKICRDGTCRPF